MYMCMYINSNVTKAETTIKSSRGTALTILKSVGSRKCMAILNVFIYTYVC